VKFLEYVAEYSFEETPRPHVEDDVGDKREEKGYQKVDDANYIELR
jgi:hypothetical protein